MRKGLTIFRALVCVLSLAACGCKHQWTDADCRQPKTCPLCGEIEGSAAGHLWQDATCDTPKTCQTCGETEGEALGHSWMDATTDAPKTCQVCAATEGEPISQVPSASADAGLVGKWRFNYAITGEMVGVPDFSKVVNVSYELEFTTDGTWSLKADFPAIFGEELANHMVRSFYGEFAEKGLSEQETDELFMQNYHMDVYEFVQTQVKPKELVKGFTEAIGAFNRSGVYYVEGELLYTGESWESEMTSEVFYLQGDILVLQSFAFMMSDGNYFFRVTE